MSFIIILDYIFFSENSSTFKVSSEKFKTVVGNSDDKCTTKCEASSFFFSFSDTSII